MQKMPPQQDSSNEEELVLSVQGMNCTACATRIERSLSKLEQVDDVAVSYPLRTAWIRGNSNKLDLSSIIEKINKLGFSAHPYTSTVDDMKREMAHLRKRLLLAILFTVPLLCSMAEHIPLLHPLLSLLPRWIFAPWLQLLLATCVQFIVGIPFYVSAYYAIRERLANMDVLVAIGTTAAYLYSHYEVFANGLEGLLHYASYAHPRLYFETSAVVITVVLLGKYIELSASLRLQEQHEPFADLQINEVMVERDGTFVPTRVEFVKIGDTVRHEEGQLIGVDGLVTEGEAYVDEALLTGEQQVIYKSKGERVWAGTTISQGTLFIETTAAGKETMLNRIRELVKQGQRSKTSIQRQVDGVVRWFVPLIVVLSIGTIATWLMLGGQRGDAVLSGLAVLLVACPCALGLAAPISLAITSSRLVKHGMIVKDAAVIERLHQVQEVMFDKTGTLTEGRLSVSFAHSFFVSKPKMLAYASALEQHAQHPIAQAIRNYSEKVGADQFTMETAQHRIGYGVIGKLGKHTLLVGNDRMLLAEQKPLPPYVQKLAEERKSLGETVCYVYMDDHCIGLLGLQDEIKHSSAPAIESLQRMNIAVSMATGDHAGSAKRVGQLVGIGNIQFDLLPQQKLQIMQRKIEKQQVVAMVGDGWNDAPALATAPVGIAMSNSTEAALHAGHMTLLYSQLTSIPLAIAMSKQTVKNIKQNLGFALVYNSFMLPFAALGQLEPWMAGIAMSLSSLCVVCNALLLHRRLQKVEVRLNDA